MIKRSHYIALGLVGLLTLVMLNLPAETSARLRRAIASMFVPVVGLSDSAKLAAGGAVDAILPRRELLRQNEVLRRENAELQLQLATGANALDENNRFRQHFEQ